MMMLGRTAANLYWLSRYVERAENVSRLLEAGYRMSLTAARGGDNEYLVSMMQAAAVDEGYYEKYETADLPQVAHYMVFDPDNASSVHCCLKNARTNARAERTALTADMWEALNSSWLEFSQIRPNATISKQLPELLSWVRRAAHQFRGALLGTALRNDGYMFSQFGNFIERADNTARILDMKYYALLPQESFVGGEMDIQQWSLILRAASAYRSYRHVYHDRFKAWNIADYLILREEMPRSLRHCTQRIDQTMAELEGLYGERSGAHEAADNLGAMVRDTDMDRIFRTGLHDFLENFMELNAELSNALSKSYNFT